LDVPGYTLLANPAAQAGFGIPAGGVGGAGSVGAPSMDNLRRQRRSMHSMLELKSMWRCWWALRQVKWDSMARARLPSLPVNPAPAPGLSGGYGATICAQYKDKNLTSLPTPQQH
jgi:hypothetical protein